VIELPPSESLPPAQPFAGGFGEVDLLGGLPPPAQPQASAADPMEADLFGEAPLPGPSTGGAAPDLHGFAPSAPPEFGSAPQFGASAPEFTPRAAPEGVQRQTGGGGTDYGEVSLDAGGGVSADVALEGGPAPAPPRANDDDMEFGAVPQEAAPGSSAQVQHVGLAGAKLAPQKPKSKLPLQILAAVFVIGLGGAALALVPSVGPFGAYFVMDRLNAGQYHALVQSTAKSANQALAQDTYPDATRATQAVARAQAGARRAKGLAALAAYVGFISELRFGTDAPTHARASVLLDELAEESDVEMLALARSARAAADGQIAKARQLLATAESQGKSVESALLRAELELRAKDAKAAIVAWEAAKKYGETPRVQYGLARAKYAGGDEKGALAEAEAVLTKHPGHVGARVLVARLSTGSRENETRALGLLERVI
jgi:hypothetical protein